MRCGGSRRGLARDESACAMCHDPDVRRWVGLVGVVAVAAGLSGPASLAGAATRSSPLQVLVTNDDGVKAPGIDALAETLRKVPGVAVTVVAPAENQSGASDHANPDPSSLHGSKTNTASGYPAIAVDGYPADSVAWALDGGVEMKPDLVVSGINSAENIGTFVPLSGTVGAARTAARRGVRALAVSQGAGNPPAYASGADLAADWVREHRAELLGRRGARPTAIVGVDNLNVPTCTTGSVRGLVRVPLATTPPTAPDCSSTLPDPKTDAEGFANGFATLTEMRSSAVCSRTDGPTGPAPTVQDPVLTEVSGVVASRAHPPVLWVHNDSGGVPAAYAMSPDGDALGAYPVDGATATDWEDIAIGPGPKRGTSYLYLGDIGDNASSRDAITVYRVAEPATAPDGAGATLTGTETFTLHYPDGPVDAEALFVDPDAGDLYIIDKEYTSGVGTVFRARSQQLVDGADVTMEQVASFTMSPDEDQFGSGLPGTIVTGADVSPDGSIVLVRTYRRVLAFARPRGAPLADAFVVDPCPAPQVNEPQGEAVGFAANGRAYYTISEGEHAPIHRFTVRR
jgi:5'/3'-nucleotidase SurE